MSTYNFKPDEAFKIIKKDWTAFSKKLKVKKQIIGISGGKDSTVVAALAVKIFGAENVIGVSMPCNGQKDMADVDLVFKTLGIERVTIDIGDAYDSILHGVENNCIEVKDDTRINLAPRLRMSTLYAVAQSVNGLVVNTDNKTESTVGYSTLFGDDAGSYAPIEGLTVTEVIALGDWLGMPSSLTHKAPADGLQEKSDEDRLGMKYAMIDKVIRENKGTLAFKKKLLKKFNANKFKTEIIQIPGPKFDYPDWISGENIG